MNNFRDQVDPKVDLIWKIADLLRGDYKPHEYADVILPLTVFRRLDQAIESSRDDVRQAYEKYKGRLDNLSSVLERAAGDQHVYNTSEFDWKRLLDSPDDINHNLVNYLNGYSPQVQDIIEKFDFRRQVGRLHASRLIYPILGSFSTVDLHPERVNPQMMGYIFEHLIRRFGEQYNETAGEHYTPREVIELMVKLIFSENEEVLHQPEFSRTIYDPACGTGGMLTVAKDYILGINDKARVWLFGQELNPTAYAVAKSDLLLKNESPENIIYGNSFSEDGYPQRKFNVMLSNPPFGVEWKKVEWVVKQEHFRGDAGRFEAGLPRINDGSLLFLQHMISKMSNDTDGSRIAIVFNGSPLFTGDAGSGESEIRRWIIENDWLEGIVALPEQLFYNTGISTYIWILTNRKSKRRKGKVQLVNAVDFYQKMRKSLGDKRNEISPQQIDEIKVIYRNFVENDTCKIYDNRFFGYRKVRIDRPLRLNFQATSERIQRLDEQSTFQKLTESRKKEQEAQLSDEEQGRALQVAIREMLTTIPKTLIKNRAEFEKILKHAMKEYGLKLTAPVYNAILNALSEKDESASPCLDKQGNIEPDTDLRDYENVPLSEQDEPDSRGQGDSYLDEKVPLTENVRDYFEREVKPFVDDAFIDTGFVDEKDRRVGKIGYEISFTRYFYRYEPPPTLEDLVKHQQNISALEKEIANLLKRVTGNIE